MQHPVEAWQYSSHTINFPSTVSLLSVFSFGIFLKWNSLCSKHKKLFLHNLCYILLQSTSVLDIFTSEIFRGIEICTHY